MLARPLSRLAVLSARHGHGGASACVSSMGGGFSSTQSSVASVAISALRRCRPSSCCLAPPQQHANRARHLSSKRQPPLDAEDENDVDVTPVGTKPWQITAEAIAEAEAADDIGDAVVQDEVDAGDPSEWEFDASTEEAFGRDGDDENPPTPILDAYERSRDPAEMERLIQMSFDSLPERAGPQRYNHKRREHQRYRTIRNIKYKEKAQRIMAYERKLQKRRDRKAREVALFATWRGADDSATADARRQSK